MNKKSVCDIQVVTVLKGLFGVPIHHTSDLKGNCISEIEGFDSPYYRPQRLPVEKLDKDRIENRWYRMVSVYGNVNYISTLEEAVQLKAGVEEAHIKIKEEENENRQYTINTRRARR